MKKYSFKVKDAVSTIERYWKDWNENTGCKKFVVGISGGIDSTTVAALACRFFGSVNVIGVSAPYGRQRDMADVNHVFKHLKIKRVDVDIYNPLNEINDEMLKSGGISLNAVAKTNLPPRLRMAVFYAVAQSVDAMVMNTCNLSETLSGYDTLFGDNCGSYAPIKLFTKTEVKKIAKYIGVPDKLVNKTPIDGLQPKTDEENFGYTYTQLDKFIRTGVATNKVKELVMNRYLTNRYKMKMVNIDSPIVDYPNYVIQGEEIC